MSAIITPRHASPPGARAPGKNRIRNSALVLLAVALAFYLGFIALLVIRSHH